MLPYAPIDAAQDEVIFSAQYSIGKVGIVLAICCLFVYLWRGITYDIARDLFEGIVVGGHGLVHFLLLGLIMLLLLLPLFPLALNPLLFKEIIFYPDRVQIVRRIFRSKTIYYANATLERGTLFPGYLVEEVRDQWQPQPTRYLHDFALFFFPAEAAKNIETILDYLTDDLSMKNPKIFKRSILTRAAANRQARRRLDA